MSEKTDQEIAVWLTGRANQGNFTVDDVRRFGVVGRATVCAWIAEDKMRRQVARCARREWVHVYESAGASTVFRATDPGQP